VDSNAALAERADAVVLCHKPGQLEEVAAEVSGRARVVISILAAVTTDRLEKAYPGVPVYRFIPNIPAEVRRGVLCYAPGSLAAEGPEREILELLGRAGTIIRLGDEPLIEPAMALMSCGPAFMALVAESFAEAGEQHGLPAGDAVRMTVETMAGAAAYLAEHGYDTEALRARVATPGGATERGLIRLEERGLREVCRDAVDAVVEGTRR
jgi:pyrroline-5-carboxylate reductase